jgi:hypothetical protein
MTEFPKGVALKATPQMIVFLAMLVAFGLRAEAAVIKDLRFGDSKGYVRMVLECDRPLSPSPSVSIRGNILQVGLTGVTGDLPDIQTDPYHDDVLSLEVDQTPDATRIEAAYAFDPADVRTFSLVNPDRFIIDAYRHLPPAAATPPVEQSRPRALIEEAVSTQKPYREPEKPLPAGGSASIDEAPVRTGGATFPVGGTADDSGRHRFQQQLIAALIVVTSIIGVLLILLIRTSGSRKDPARASWVHDLPPTRDREIESIDAAIIERLKSHDHP